MKKVNYFAIDIAKYISALLVVCIHTFPLLDVSEPANTFLIQAVCRIAVPFFFAVSSIMFFSKKKAKRGPNDPENLFQLKHYLRRLGILYLVWSAVYLPYTFLLWRSSGYAWTFVVRWIFDFFFNGSYYHLWFLPSLILATVIVYQLYTRIKLVWGMLVCLLLYTAGMLMNVYGDLLACIPFIRLLYQLYMSVFTTARNGIFFAPIFLYVGIYLKSSLKTFSSKKYLTGTVVFYIALLLEEGLALLCGMIHDLTSMYLMLVPLVYFLVGLLLQVQSAPSRMGKFLRQSSLLIYVSHILFAVPLLALYPNHHLLVYLLTVIGSQLFSLFIIAASNRIRWLSVLY